MAKLRTDFDFDDARVIAHRAGPIPVGGSVIPFSNERVMLIGDAADHVSPLTAAGIHSALEVGRISGRAVAGYLLDDGPHPAETVGAHAPSNPVKRALRAAMNLAPPNRLIDAVAFSRPALAIARLVFFHHRGLLSTEGWRALTRPVEQARRSRRLG